MVRLALFLVLFALAVRVTAGEVRLTVAEPSGVARKGWPVTSGIPFAQGALPDPGASALFDADGRELPLQTEALATWPDGSVRWLLLDFQIDLAANEAKALTLRHGPGVTRAPIANPLESQAPGPGGVSVQFDTGPLSIVLAGGRENGDICNIALLTSQAKDRPGPPYKPLGGYMMGTRLVGASGKLYHPSHFTAGPWKLTVEQAGPLRACVKLEGRYASVDGKSFRYVVRIHAFRGQPFLRIDHTFVNTRQDSLMAKLRKLELSIGEMYKVEGNRHTVLAGASGRRGTLLQVDELTHQADGKMERGRVPGWASVGGEQAGLAVGLREWWQNWPKSLTVSEQAVTVGLMPEVPKGLYDGKPIEEESKLYYYLRDGVYTFKVGVAKTHELWATFYKGKPDVEKLTDFFKAAEDPLLATCEPAHVDSTKALGDLPPADPKQYGGYDGWIDKALDAHLKRREEVREYGTLNYGDWFGERGVNWGNLEYDLQHGLFMQYLRTGDRRFFLRAEQAARHHIDVDVVHATNPHLKNPWGPPPQVGEIWLHALNHTGGYDDEKTSKLPVSRTYHMGHSTNFGHVWVSGDLDYYYLTGDRRARDVAIQVADAMLRHMPNAYGTHIRTLGWPTIICLAAYDLTQEKKYLDGARKNWEELKKNIDWKKGWVIRLAKGHCLHKDRDCHGNVPFMEGMVLCALARYHRITQDPEVLRAITVGIDQMIRECWQEDVKTFRYTACPLSSKAPYGLFFLSAEAMAYEIAQTGNKEHLRILREGLRAAIPKDDGYHHGKSLGQMIFFTPHALRVLEE